MSFPITLATGLLFAVVPTIANAANGEKTVAGKAPERQTVKRPVTGSELPNGGAPAAAAEKGPAPQAPAVAKTESELYAVESGILAHTNAQRARYGLRPLMLDFGLLRSARRHAQWMSRNHTMQHTTAPVAENIAMGQQSPQDALNSWMNSSGHRANILNTGYTRIGVAAYRNSNGTTFWCQQFSR
jgi:uncharacterized protein YkwD